MESTATKKYIETVGRRKTSTARVRITESAKNTITVNDQDVNDFFKTDMLRHVAAQPFSLLKLPVKFKVTAVVNGGGVSSQAESVRHGLSRALIEYDILLRGALKKEGFLKRDPRAKERRKFGLKKARKAPQWSKR